MQPEITRKAASRSCRTKVMDNDIMFKENKIKLGLSYSSQA